MTVQGLGACVLTALMRADRGRDSDTSWLLFGPAEAPAELDETREPENVIWKFAAE